MESQAMGMRNVRCALQHHARKSDIPPSLNRHFALHYLALRARRPPPARSIDRACLLLLAARSLARPARVLSYVMALKEVCLEQFNSLPKSEERAAGALWGVWRWQMCVVLGVAV